MVGYVCECRANKGKCRRKPEERVARNVVGSANTHVYIGGVGVLGEWVNAANSRKLF